MLTDLRQRALRTSTLVLIAGLVAAFGYVAMLLREANSGSWDRYAALLIAPVFLLAAVPLAHRLTRVTGDAFLGRLLLWGAAAKLVGAMMRYFFVFGVYGNGDSVAYARTGVVLAQQIRDGYLVLPADGPLVGTRFLEVVTGSVFAVIGPSTLGGFLVFSFFGFLGIYFFIRAVHLSMPDLDLHRYAAIVLFLPSLVFWPSSIGKESWMLMGLGLSALGVAKVTQHARGGYLTLGLGLLATAMVRPHMSLLVCGGMAVAVLLRRPSPTSRTFGPLARVTSVAVVVIATALLLTQAEQYFGVDNSGVTGLETVLGDAAERTNQGGSEFEAVQARSPAALPAALFAVMFRPLPNEATNVQSLAASLEGLVLLGLFVTSWKRLRRLPSVLRHHPYMAFVVAYTLLFAVAFSSFGNFGILTRQRVQLFPFALTLLAIQAAKVSRHSERHARSAAPVAVR